MTQPTDNKQVRLYNTDGNYARVSVDELIAHGYNQWQDWHCSAGARNLYIDYDGNVWVANCASSRHYSQVHKQKVDDWQASMNDVIDDEWRAYREAVIGEYPHKDWVIENVGEEHWPMPKENWETCTAHLKLMEEIDRLEKQFFRYDIRNNKHYKDFLKNTDSWQWRAKEDSKVWGLLGSIFTSWTPPETWLRCPFSSCGCGADVILSKAKDSTAVKNLHVTNHQFEGQPMGEVVPSVANPCGIEMNFPIVHQILWDITRRCNYDCSYCWPSVHNNVESYHEFEKIIETINLAVDTWAGGEEIRWNFGGGEPTMHPKFLDILQHLTNKKQWVLVTTNGARSNKYFTEMVKYCNSINMSAHFESMDQFKGNEDRFIENCRVIIDHHKKVDKDHWLEIKLMTPPGLLERAQQFKDKIVDLGLEQNGANGRQIGAISLVPIRAIDDSQQLVDYSDNELGYFQQQ